MAYTLQYYDLVLAGIIGAIGLGGVIGAFTMVEMPVAIVGLGGVSIGIMGHAMFVNGPIDDVDDLTEEVEDAPVPPENLPLVK